MNIGVQVPLQDLVLRFFSVCTQRQMARLVVLWLFKIEAISVGLSSLLLQLSLTVSSSVMLSFFMFVLTISSLEKGLFKAFEVEIKAII